MSLLYSLTQYHSLWMVFLYYVDFLHRRSKPKLILYLSYSCLLVSPARWSRRYNARTKSEGAVFRSPLNQPKYFFLSNGSFHIGVALKIGLEVCVPLNCRCGAKIDNFLASPFSWRSSDGRFPRHYYTNKAREKNI